MEATKEEFRYSNGGSRLCYHPDMHPNHGKPWTTRELAYLAYHYKRGHLATLALDLGRTHATVSDMKYRLVGEGRFEELKKIYEDRYL